MKIKDIKINKKILLIPAIIIFALILGTSLSKYTLKETDTHTLSATQFYFESEIADVETGKENAITNWDGKNTEIINFNVKNYTDNLQQTQEEIKYKIQAQIVDNSDDGINDKDLIDVQIQDLNGTSILGTEELVLSNSGLNKDNYKLKITPKSNSLENGRIFNIQVKISSTEPYEKELITNLQVGVNVVENYELSILEATNKEYVTLNIKANNPVEDLSIKYDNAKLILDKSNYFVSELAVTEGRNFNSFNLEKTAFEAGKIYEINFIKTSSTDTIVLGEDIKIEDAVGPTVTVTRTNATESSITVNVEANDPITGMPDEPIYSYYIKKKAEQEYQLIAQYITDSTYTFTGLESETTYTIKVTTEDLLENVGEGFVNATTSEFAFESGSITFAKAQWANNKATVEVKNNSSYDMQYQIVPKDGTVDPEGTWTTVTDPTVEVSDLIYRDTLVVRLYDGLNATKKYATCIITETIKPQVTLTEIETTTKTIEVLAVATDDESGIDTTTKQYKFYKSTTIGEFSNTAEGTSADGKFTFTELDTNTTYYIKAEIEDVAGNKGEATIASQTKLVPAAEQNVTRDIKWQSNGTAIITLTTETEFEILTSTDKTTWTDYTQAISVTNGETIYICLTDGRNKGEYYELKVEDNQGPQVTVTKAGTTSNSISVQVDAQDADAGMSAEPQYTYYINEQEKTTTTSANYVFTGLNAETTYNIKVVTKDLLGNPGEGTLDVTTNEFTYADGNITFTNPTWENKQASVEITNNTIYNMQYQVIPKDGEIDIEGTWQTVDTKEVTVGKLKDDYQIIVRLTDGTNTTTGYATCRIDDNTAPTVEITGNATEWINQDVTLTINASDSESGLQEQAYSFDGGNTWQAENTKTYEQNTEGIVIKVRDEAGNITTNTIEINKIDKTGPNVNVETNSTSNTVKVEITTITDDGIGLEETPIYIYYITENSAELDTITGEESTSKIKEYTGLNQNKTYYIKVEIQDKLGNVSSIYKTVTTGSLDADSSALTITDPVWADKKATVTITNNSEYKVEYQVLANAETFAQTDGWTLTAEKEIVVSDLLHGNVVYARLTDETNVGGTVTKEIKDETAPTVTVEGNPTEWTNQNVILTVNALDLSSGLQVQAYSFDGGETWQEENTKIYEQNTAGIVIKVRDEAGNITTNTIEINKIDKQGPNVVIETGDITTKQITVNVTASDSEAGMLDAPTYIYIIKEDGETEYIKKAETTDTTYTFENLKANTKYYIKVETADKLGNISAEEITLTTKNLLYAVGDITFTNVIWSNGIATVTVNNARNDFDMEYKIDDGSWTAVTEKTISIGNLKDKQVIYARLTDGVNFSTGYATCNIENPAQETYTDEELAQNTIREEFEILGISVANDEIRVQIDGEQENAQLYTYYYKTINDDKYTLISTSTYHDQPAVITDVKEGATYKIKALVLNEDGTVARSKNTATTIALGQAEENTTYTNNRTYIDNSKQLQVRTEEGTETVNAGYTVSLPETFKVSNVEGETKQSEGIIIKDSSDNEFVWIPVNDAIYDGITQIPTTTAETKTYKPMAKLQNGYTNYYESIIYAFNGIKSYQNTNNTGIGKSGYREPSLITNYATDGYSWNMPEITGVDYDATSQYYKDILGFTTTQEFGEYLASNYNKMVMAVDSYGGFLVGRYETTMTETDGNIVVGSKPNSTILSTYNWYNLNLYQDSQRYSSNPYSNTKSVVSSMIFGSQWDAMLNYILTGADSTKVTAKIGLQKNEISNSAQDETDIINNLYDLGSNANEWTQEANSTQYRVFRGGGYDSSKIAVPATRGTVIPTDSGPIFGSRLGLYVRSTNDVDGPVVKVDNMSSTTNTITINVTATDKETGVDKYTYYISEDGESYTKISEGVAGTYTFTNLKQLTTYYIKITATDGAGNVGQETIVTCDTQELGNVAESAITRKAKYGLNGQGTIQLQLDSTYTEQGYYIEYQVVESGQTVDMDGTWIKGELVENLSNGQILYATLFDGRNRSSDYFEEVVAGLEGYEYYIDSNGNSSETKTVLYSDGQDTAYIPAGFKVGTGDSVSKINDGLVIQDASGNEFVWVPVETAIETDTSKTSTEKAMARYQAGSTRYFEGILYNFSGTTSTKQSSTNVLGTSASREPSLVTAADFTWDIPKGTAKGKGSDTLENAYKHFQFGTNVNAFNSYTEFGQYMNEEYTNMIKSVEKYGGFYVGRYETSLSGTEGNYASVVQSQKDVEPIKSQNWYKDYYYQDSNINPKNPYYGFTSVTSSMIWGSQWDAIMNWMLKDDNTKGFVNKVTGNRTGIIAKSGSYTDDFAKNIFDMSANVTEWTQEANSAGVRLYRGGSQLLESYANGKRAASSRYVPVDSPPGATYVYTGNGEVFWSGYLGTRMSLYIKNIEDITKPDIELTNIEKGTNYITVTVNAEDEESGIRKYKYTMSFKDFKSDDFEESDILLETEAYSWTYTFEKLIQNQVYYIKIEAINGVGISDICYTGQIQTDALNVQENPIGLEKVYGKDGEGTAYFTMKDEFAEEGYNIEYQVGEAGADFDVNGTWTIGDIVRKLSVGDIIYTRINDGNNNTGYYKTAEIKELETFSDVKSTTEIYKDYDTAITEDGEEIQTLVGEAYIPAGFKVGTSSLNKKIQNGLVIEDEIGNQYVWIPVENAVYDGVTTLAQSGNTSIYKPLVRYQSGYSTETVEQYFEGIPYNYSGTSSYVQRTGYTLGTYWRREPTLVTGSKENYSWVYSSGTSHDAANYTTLSSLGINDATEMGQYMNSRFNEMVTSVEKYGGFYVGRYETSLWATDNWADGGTNSQNSGTIIKSVPNARSMANMNWYNMYLRTESNYEFNPYYSSTSVNSSMIWGCQWDAMLNYILQGSDKLKVTTVTGNHTGHESKTGQFPTDIMNNIFDLSSNVTEWTQEGYENNTRVSRGGWFSESSVATSEVRGTMEPTKQNATGSRYVLYLK